MKCWCPDIAFGQVSAEEAALFIKNGMTIGMSGFTRSGEAKAVPLALAKRAAQEELKITLMTGASLGNDLDKILTQAGVLARRSFAPSSGVFKFPPFFLEVYKDQGFNPGNQPTRATRPEVHKEHGGITRDVGGGNCALS